MPIPVSPGNAEAQAEEAGRMVFEKRGPGGRQESVTVVMASIGGGWCQRGSCPPEQGIGQSCGGEGAPGLQSHSPPTRPPCLPVTAPDVRSQQAQPGGWMLSPLMGAAQTAALDTVQTAGLFHTVSHRQSRAQPNGSLVSGQ